MTSARRARRAIGRADAGERLASLRAAHLPVAWAKSSLTMRCHRRFHEYLIALLERLPPEKVRALRLAHGRLLAEEGLHEEATEELLRADAPEAAFRSARYAIFAVIERVDYATAERWIATLEPVAPSSAHDWVEAQLLLGFTKLEYARSEQISDRLLKRGEREALASSSERAAALMGWNYLDAARIEDFKAVLAVAPEGPALAAVKYRAWLTYNVEPGQKPVAPPRTGGPFDSAILIADYLLGRLEDLPESEGSAWALGLATPWRIAMLRARGQTQRAIELYEEATRSLSVPHSRMLSIFIGPELLVDAGRRDEARAAVAEGRRVAQADGSLSPLASTRSRRRSWRCGWSRIRRWRARCSTAPRRSPTSAGSRGRPRCSTRSTGWPCCSRATTSTRSRACARRWRRCAGATGSWSCPRQRSTWPRPSGARATRTPPISPPTSRSPRPASRGPTTSSCRRSPTCPRCSRAASTARRARTRSGTRSAAR